MFMLSIKLSRKRMLIGTLALAVVITASVAAANHFGGGNGSVQANKLSEKEIVAASEKKKEPEQKKTTKKNTVKKAAAKTNEDRINFIESFGWEVDPEPAEVMEVIIPKEFDEVYENYNSIQKMQGGDLAPYAGKRAKRYSYTVLNYPGVKENVRINLLVLGNKVIGGDVSSLDAGGFMHGFAME